MQVSEFIKDNLSQYGLWPEEAEQVVDLIRASDTHADLAAVLDKNIEGYPPQFAAVTMAVAKSQAVSLLKETKPSHFALVMIEGEGAFA